MEKGKVFEIQMYVEDRQRRSNIHIIRVSREETQRNRME